MCYEDIINIQPGDYACIYLTIPCYISENYFKSRCQKFSSENFKKLNLLNREWAT